MATRRSKTDRPFTVIVEGNIGSGKTTFLNHLQKHDICVLAEPIEMWRNCNGNNLLVCFTPDIGGIYCAFQQGLLYENPTRWSFTFQMYVLLTMARNHALKTGQPIKVMERSLFSARYCFIEKLASEGSIPAPSLCVMDEYFKWICSNSDADVDLIGKFYGMCHLIAIVLCEFSQSLISFF